MFGTHLGTADNYTVGEEMTQTILKPLNKLLALLTLRWVVWNIWSTIVMANFIIMISMPYQISWLTRQMSLAMIPFRNWLIS
jgi:hypothetical protein